jgi:hypothetical protein
VCALDWDRPPLNRDRMLPWNHAAKEIMTRKGSCLRRRPPLVGDCLGRTVASGKGAAVPALGSTVTTTATASTSGLLSTALAAPAAADAPVVETGDRLNTSS